MIVGGALGKIAVVFFLLALFFFWTGNMPAGFLSLVIGAGIGELARRRAEKDQISESDEFNDDPAMFVQEGEAMTSSAENSSNLDELEDRADEAYEAGQLEVAEQLYRQAAALGSDYAMHSLGFILFDTDPVEAKRWYMEAAEAGNEYSMNNLGTIARDEGKFDEAETWYVKAAERGHVASFYLLGTMVREKGLQEQAKEWFLQGAEAGDLPCMHSYGRLLERDQVPPLAEKWADIVQEGGSGDAAWWFHTRATGNATRAKWALLAAERGHPKALQTTIILDHPDRERVKLFLEGAAEKGDKATYRLLGRIYMEEKSFEAAERWLLLSSQVDAEGKSRLVECYVAAGKFDEAAPLMESASQESAFLYATHRKNVGDIEGFEKWLLHAVSRSAAGAQTYPEAMELARLYESQGKIFQAEVWYRTAVVAESSGGNRAAACLSAAEFFERYGDRAEADRIRSELKTSEELSGLRWPARELEDDILSMFFLYYCDPSLGNAELTDWAADHFFALANARSLAFMQYRNQGWGAVLRRKAFLSMLDITNLRGAIEGMDIDKRPSSIAEFIELVDSNNEGRFARHDEI